MRFALLPRCSTTSFFAHLTCFDRVLSNLDKSLSVETIGIVERSSGGWR